MFLRRGRLTPAPEGESLVRRKTTPPLAPDRPSEINPLEHQREFASVHLHVPMAGRRGRRQRERATLQPLVDNQVPRPIPHQQLDSVASAVQKDKEMPTERLFANEAPCGGRQPVKPPTQIDGLRRHEDAHGRGQRQHVTLSSSTARTRRKSSAAKPGATRTTRTGRPAWTSIAMGTPLRSVAAPSPATRTGWKRTGAASPLRSRNAQRARRPRSRRGVGRTARASRRSPATRQRSPARRLRASTADAPSPRLGPSWTSAPPCSPDLGQVEHPSKACVTKHGKAGRLPAGADHRRVIATTRRRAIRRGR